MSDLQNRVAALQKRIFDEDYYTELWLRALNEHGSSTLTIDQGEHSDKELIELANTFWWCLPDSPVIRRGPFFELCDVAELCYSDLT